jgi:hypothetical protein
VQIGGGVRVSDAFQSEAELVTHSNMRTVVLCLNSSGVALRHSVRQTRECDAHQQGSDRERGVRGRVEDDRLSHAAAQRRT